MRENLFRGKRVDNGEWVEGYYAKAKDYLSEDEIHVIFPLDLTLYPHGEFSSYEEINPETLGRLTRYPDYDSDHTGYRFFQGDIIGVYQSRHADIKHKEPDAIAIVVDEHCITENGLGRWFPQDTTQVKVIGNVHDDPELVGKKYADLYKYYHCLNTSVTRDDLKRNMEVG